MAWILESYTTKGKYLAYLFKMFINLQKQSDQSECLKKGCQKKKNNNNSDDSLTFRRIDGDKN